MKKPPPGTQVGAAGTTPLPGYGSLNYASTLRAEHAHADGHASHKQGRLVHHIEITARRGDLQSDVAQRQHANGITVEHDPTALRQVLLIVRVLVVGGVVDVGRLGDVVAPDHRDPLHAQDATASPKPPLVASAAVEVGVDGAAGIQQQVVLLGTQSRRSCRPQGRPSAASSP
jgi:hypothetical protein